MKAIPVPETLRYELTFELIGGETISRACQYGPGPFIHYIECAPADIGKELVEWMASNPQALVICLESSSK